MILYLFYSFFCVMSNLQNTSTSKIILTKEKIEERRKLSKGKKIVLTPAKLYPPPTIDFPPDEYRTARPYVDVRGTVKPMNKLQLKARDQDLIDTIADENGKFFFFKIHLSGRTNTITVFNKSLTSNEFSEARVSFTVYYDSTLAPYFDRIDPITRVNLSSQDLIEIVLCRSCKIYQLYESWVSVGNKCTVCPGNECIRSHEDEFWLGE